MSFPMALPEPPALAAWFAEARAARKEVLLVIRAWPHGPSAETLVASCGEQWHSLWRDAERGETCVVETLLDERAAAGPQRFEVLAAWAQTAREETHEVVVGATPPPLTRALHFAAAFGDHPPSGPWGGLPSACAFRPSRAWVWNRDGCWQVDRYALATEAAAAPGGTSLARSPEGGVQDEERDAPSMAALEAADLTCDAAFHARVRDVLCGVERGAWRKVVLSRAKRHPAPPGLSVTSFLGRFAHSPRPPRFVFALRLPGGRLFAGASPELLLEAGERGVCSMALAGTQRVPRAAGDDKRRSLAAALLVDPKELREHHEVVTGVGERIASLGWRVHAQESPQVLHLDTLVHLWTPLPLMPVAEDASPPWRLVRAMHPTPAVGGAPAKEALAYLDATESRARGLFSGCIGWLEDQRRCTVAVALRCALLTPDHLWIYAGAGVVAGSDAAREWAETEGKMAAMEEVWGV